MPKIIKRELVIPKMSREAADLMREAACSDDVDCRGVDCINCLFGRKNLDYFIWFFNLDELQDTVTVKESIEEVSTH